VSSLRAVCFRLAVTLTLSLLGSVTSGPAQAESVGDEQVELHMLACEPAFAAELRRIVRLELGGLLYEGEAGGSAERGRLEVRCESNLARVSARDARRTQQANNDLRFDAFPGDAAPRAVALAAVEALRAVDPTLSARIDAQRTAAAAEERKTTPRERTPTTSRPTTPAPPVRPEAARGWTRIGLGPVVRHFPSDPQMTLWGAHVELNRRSPLPVDYGLDLEGAVFERSVDLGAIDVRTLSAAAWIGWRAGLSDWSFTAGAGGRVGIAELEGSSRDPTVEAHHTARIWSGPLAILRGDAGFGVFSPGLVLEAGWALAGAEGLAGGATVAGARGVWLALSLNPGIRF
jgi:hypothetical protein